MNGKDKATLERLAGYSTLNDEQIDIARRIANQCGIKVTPTKRVHAKHSHGKRKLNTFDRIGIGMPLRKQPKRKVIVSYVSSQEDLEAKFPDTRLTLNTKRRGTTWSHLERDWSMYNPANSSELTKVRLESYIDNGIVGKHTADSGSHIVAHHEMGYMSVRTSKGVERMPDESTRDRTQSMQADIWSVKADINTGKYGYVLSDLPSLGGDRSPHKCHKLVDKQGVYGFCRKCQKVVKVLHKTDGYDRCMEYDKAAHSKNPGVKTRAV